MFSQQNVTVDFEKTPCVFAHPRLDGVYFSDNSPQGLTQQIHQATKYTGEKARVSGFKKLKEKYPSIKDGDVIFCYI